MSSCDMRVWNWLKKQLTRTIINRKLNLFNWNVDLFISLTQSTIHERASRDLNHRGKLIGKKNCFEVIVDKMQQFLHRIKYKPWTLQFIIDLYWPKLKSWNRGKMKRNMFQSNDNQIVVANNTRCLVND